MQFRFRLFNIPFTVGIDFLFIAFLLATNRIAQPAYLLSWVIVVFCSIIVHELGHAFAFRYFGYSPQIRLHSFGGETSISGENKLKPWQDVLISLAGPLTGLIIGGGLYYGLKGFARSELLNVVLDDIWWVNIGWSLINLLPLFPLDGGRIAKTAISSLFKKRGEIIFYIFSMVVALAAAAISLYFRLYWTALIAGSLFINNIQAYRYVTTIGKDVDFREEFKQVYALLNTGKFAEAQSKAQALFEQVQSLPMKSLALNLCAWALYKQGDLEQALNTLNRQTDPKQKDQYLYGILLFENERFTEAKPILIELFSKRQDEQLGWMLFKTLEQLQDFDTLYTMIMRYPGSQLSKELYVAIAAFFHSHNRFNEACEISALLFNKLKVPDAPYNVACSKCRLGDVNSALRWLEKAVKSGYRDRLAMENDPDLACLKGESKFQELMSFIQT